ncbi:PepSY-associated TM helix domain-containing protein [Nonomuraea glycinis]|uniref:PepSY-associated TM helix domain-containing protein n=1 Tax=Nonomuraea glycinis TaxID=2047744 RepID=UPI002E0DC21D|nr:PepSY domain-containing protein [Nonomuraea glycinis]
MTTEHVPTADTTETARDGEPKRRGVWAQLRPLVLRMHFYAGVFIAPFILLAAVTGLLYTAAPQIEQIVYSHELHVPAGEKALPLSAQVSAARAAHPAGDVTSVMPAIDETSTTRVVFSDNTVPPDYAMAVFVDPYTAEIRGQVQTFGQWLGVRAWIDDLHRNLHLGAFGRNYSELAASWMWIVVLGGIALWLGRRRADRRLRRVLLPDTSKRGRARNLSWHASTGIWIALGLLLLSVTGLTWSNYAGAQIADIRSVLEWTSRPLETSLTATTTAGDSEHQHGSPDTTAPADAMSTGVGIDGVMSTARAQGLRVPLFITPPDEAGKAWTVAESKRDWPTRFDAITVDGATGSVVDRVDFADWPFMAKMTNWTIDAHMGILFGPANQLILAALAVGVIYVILRGYLMWWQRRPTSRTEAGPRFGRPAPRGSLRALSPWVLVLVIVSALAVGYFVPLFGVSLAVFLVVDTLLGLKRAGGRPVRLSASLPEAPADDKEPEDQVDDKEGIGA